MFIKVKSIISKINQTPVIKAVVASMNDSNKYMRLMFNAAPLSCSLWNSDFRIIDCNEESAKLFNLGNKDEFIEKFHTLSPKYQPNGQLSSEQARKHIKKAFDNGYNCIEWTHYSANGEFIPCEIHLVKVEHKGKPMVAAYIRDLSELKTTLNNMGKVEDDLRLALFTAADSAKAKSVFLDNMSHELCTPMNAILGFLRMMGQTDLSDEQYKYVSEAEFSAKSLMKIISDVLEFTDIEEKKIKINSSQFSLSDVFKKLHEKFSSAASAKDLDLIVRLPPDMPDFVIGDREKLDKILGCFIENAIKFTNSGKVTVRAGVEHLSDNFLEVQFYVRDTGIGILPEQMDQMFEPFWQADASFTRANGGAGLGLALARQLAPLLGGKVWAKSVYEEGTSFFLTARFSLPYSAETPPDTKQGAEPPPEANQNNETAPDTKQSVESPPEARHNYGNLFHLKQDIRLLIAEDVEINQFIAVELLTSMGYIVDIAGNGQEVVDMVANNDYDAVLMDMQMPVMDGLTATKIIRETEKNKALPIIAVSAHSTTEEREKNFICGVNDHLTKPIDPTELERALEKWLM